MGRLGAEQIEARRLGIGSSDVAAILGVSPYEGATPLGVWLEKTGQDVPEEDDERDAAFEIGHLLEPVLLAKFAADHGVEVVTGGVWVESLVHAEKPWARANLDGIIVAERAAVEVKTVGVGMMRDWDLGADDGIPHYVRIQVLWQMYVADLEKAYVVALVGGPSGYRVYEVPRDRELEAVVVGEVEAFWRTVEARTPPELDGSAMARAWLDRLYPQPDPPVVVSLDMTEEHERIRAIGIGRLLWANHEREAKASKDTLSNALVKAFGELGCTTIESVGEWRATYQAKPGKPRRLLIRSTQKPTAPGVRADVEGDWL